MDYQHKYIKYKTKYLDLKENNQTGGVKDKLLFILFQGAGSVKEDWNNFGKTDFFERLEKHGKIYKYDPVFYQQGYYDDEYKKIL